MCKVYNFTNMPPALSKEQLAEELKNAGFYPNNRQALEVVNYWTSQGLTIEQIREEYHL